MDMKHGKEMYLQRKIVFSTKESTKSIESPSNPTYSMEGVGRSAAGKSVQIRRLLSRLGDHLDGVREEQYLRKFVGCFEVDRTQRTHPGQQA